MARTKNRHISQSETEVGKVIEKIYIAVFMLDYHRKERKLTGIKVIHLKCRKNFV